MKDTAQLEIFTACATSSTIHLFDYIIWPIMCRGWFQRREDHQKEIGKIVSENESGLIWKAGGFKRAEPQDSVFS